MVTGHRVTTEPLLGEAEPLPQTPWSRASPPTRPDGSSLTLQHRVGLQQLFFNLVHLLALPTHRRHIGHHQLTGLWEATHTHTHTHIYISTTVSPKFPLTSWPQSPIWCRVGRAGLVWSAERGEEAPHFHTAHRRPACLLRWGSLLRQIIIIIIIVNMMKVRWEPT